jgi:DNA-directed RNA polymerase specialized sigma24 family protein
MADTATTTKPRARGASKLGPVEKKGTRYAKVREDVLRVRGELDAAIHEARLAGTSYKEIAEAAGVSVSWVQTSLGRSGYKPAGRVRGNSNTD